MIKQTVSYGVWTLNRHDDNKIEVLKNGQVCEKASPAYREIATEIGFEIDPEWRTSQLGRNVFKAVENAVNSSSSSTTVSTPVKEKKTSATEQETTSGNPISEDKNTQPINEVCQHETISVFDVILQSEGENKLQVVKAVKEQLGIGLKEAKDIVDAAPSTIVKGVDKSTAETIKSELNSNGACVIVCSSAQTETLENIISVIKQKEKEENEKLTSEKYQLRSENEKLKSEVENWKNNYSELYGKYRDFEIKFNNSSQLADYRKGKLEEKENEIANLKTKLKEKEAAYERLLERDEILQEKYNNLRWSSSSSSSRSSGDEKVTVNITFKTDNAIWTMLHGKKTITMPKSEYKSLLNGSMTARIAYVQAKFGVPSNVKVSSVNISLS